MVRYASVKTAARSQATSRKTLITSSLEKRRGRSWRRRGSSAWPCSTSLHSAPFSERGPFGKRMRKAMEVAGEFSHPIHPLGDLGSPAYPFTTRLFWGIQPEIRSRILVQSNFTTETQRTRSSRSNIIKCCNIFPNLCVLCVSVVKTADFEIEYRYLG